MAGWNAFVARLSVASGLSPSRERVASRIPLSKRNSKFRVLRSSPSAHSHLTAADDDDHPSAALR